MVPVKTLMLSYSLFFLLLLEEITAQSCHMERLRRGIKGGRYQYYVVLDS
jgi:hypothetical protein